MSELDERRRPMFDRLLHEGKVAVIFLTSVPVQADRPVTPRDLADSAPFFPLAGAGLGLAAALVFVAAGALGLPPLVAATLAVTTLVLLTGALHEDGLADTADGFGGGTTPAIRLEIMRDPRTGSFGVLALVLSVLVRVGAIAALAEPMLVVAALIAAGGLSRAPLPAMMRLLPAARADGLAAGAGQPVGPRAMASVAIGVMVAGLALGPLAGAVALLVTAAAAAGTGALAWRKIGGITGDVLGAAQQTAEAGVLIALAALAPALA